MREHLAALLLLEYRQFRNRLKATARQPSRLILYVAVSGYFVLMALLRAAHSPGASLTAIPEPYASAAAFAYLTFLGIVAYGAASGIAGAFSSQADALFLSGSHLDERLVVLWLQLRRSAGALLRMTFALLFYTLLFFRSGSFTGALPAVLGTTLLCTGVTVPVLKLRSIAGARIAQSMAGAFTAIAILAMVVLLASVLHPLAAAGTIEAAGFGRTLGALLHGNVLALGTLFGIDALLLPAAYACGTGLYPDLYAASLRVFAFRERSKRGGAAAFTVQPAFRRKAVSSAENRFAALRGAWAIAWKEYVGFSRSVSMQRTFALGAFGCAAIGAVAGSVARHSADPAGVSIAFASSAANVAIVFVAIGSAIGLGEDLRKPLWWIGPDPLWLRLFAWVLGTSWRLAACVAAGVIAWAATMHWTVVAAAGLPVAIAGVLQLRAVGLAIYSLFPSSIDQRGPLAMVRALLTFLLALPAAVAGIAIGILLHAAGAGLTAGIAASVLETIALIAFSAARIDGRGISIAQAEAA